MAYTSSVIPATVHMISGCEDKQTSADVFNVAEFELPDPAGRAGGACTSALLKVLYSNLKNDLTFSEVLMQMREILSDGGYTQIPQMTSSRYLNVKESFYIVPPGCEGTKRALLIGINYVGQNGELSGCHNDVLNVRDYLVDELGFQEKNVTLLMDDGSHKEPTRANILGAYRTLVNSSRSGDAVYCHYSGHGGRLRDDNGDEEDGYDETLIPVDYHSYGQIRDDVLYKKLVGALAKGVNLTAVMDCCHSGTVLDLPYKFKADGVDDEMTLDETADMGKIEHYATQLINGKRWCVPLLGSVAVLAVIGLIAWYFASS